MARRFRSEAARSRLPVVGLALATTSLGLVGVAGYGGQQGWWTAEQAVGSLPYIGALALAGLLAGLIGRFRGARRHEQLIGALAIVVGLVVVGGIGQYLWRVAHAPPLDDVSTDLLDPPAFVRLPVRADRIAHVPLPHRPGYERLSGEERWRAAQGDAYPDLRTQTVPVSPARVVGALEAAAHRRRWIVVFSNPGGGHLELSVPSRFFGYVDDLVVRARPAGGGSTVDVRGIARTGDSDHGRIAKLIRRIQADVARLH